MAVWEIAASVESACRAVGSSAKVVIHVHSSYRHSPNLQTLNLILDQVRTANLCTIDTEALDLERLLAQVGGNESGEAAIIQDSKPLSDGRLWRLHGHDLARYAILHVHGGIFMEVHVLRRSKPVNGFNKKTLNREWWWSLSFSINLGPWMPES